MSKLSLMDSIVRPFSGNNDDGDNDNGEDSNHDKDYNDEEESVTK